MKQYQQRQMQAENLQSQIAAASNIHIVDQAQRIAAAVSAYENTIITYDSSNSKDIL